MDAARKLLEATELWERRGEYVIARKRCSEALRLDPDSWEAAAKLWELEELLGLAAESKRSLALAEKAMRKALKRDPRDAKLRLHAAELLERLGRYGQARRELLLAVRLDPDPLPARLLLAVRALWAGRAEEAVLRAQEILALDPALGEARRIVGAARVLQGRFAEALSPLKRALAADPRDAEALAWRSEALRYLGRNSEALSAGAAGRAISDNALGANANHALAKLAAGERVSELEYSLISRLLPRPLQPLSERLDPERPRAAARALERVLKALKGNRGQAKVWTRGTRLEPFVACDISDQMEILQSRLRGGDLRAVLAEYRRLIRQKPREAWFYAFRGETLCWAARYGEAEADFHRALELAPRLRWPHVGLCGTALFSGDYEAALAHCENAVRDAAPDRSWRTLRGEALRKLGRLTEAREDLEVAVAAMPRRLSAWMNLALVLGELGEEAEADRLFSRICGWAPHFFSLCARSLPVPSRAAVLERGLELMAGNRSSWLTTWLDGGRLRNVHVEFRD